VHPCSADCISEPKKHELPPSALLVAAMEDFLTKQGTLSSVMIECTSVIFLLH
jgi:hypothetical protein